MAKVKEKTKILVIDDDPKVVWILSEGLSSNFEFVSARDGVEGIQMVSTEKPDLVLLDIKMPGLNGMDLFKELCKADYSMPVVFVTGHGDIHTGVQAIKEGAVDFLTKPVDDEQMLNAVLAALARDVLEREKHVDKVKIWQLLRKLTDREYEVMTYVITGMLNKQIAYVLGISEKTVKVHRGRVMEKLGVHSVADLVRLAEKVGVQPPDTSIS